MAPDVPISEEIIAYSRLTEPNADLYEIAYDKAMELAKMLDLEGVFCTFKYNNRVQQVLITYYMKPLEGGNNDASDEQGESASESRFEQQM